MAEISSVLLTGAIIFLVSTIAFFLLSLNHHEDKRVFHIITLFVTGIASIAYFIMAFGGGKIVVQLAEDGDDRDFFYIRYFECVARVLP